MKSPFHKSSRQKIAPLSTKPTAEVVFIAAGLKAALYSQTAIRASVLNDVSKALNCPPEALNFLFNANDEREKDQNVFDFPDEIRRRTIIRDNFLDAAE